MDVVAPSASARIDTWPKVLEHNAGTLGARRKAMRYKHYGIWQSYSWQEYLDNVKYLALGLLALGFAPGDKLLVIGDNCPQWYFAELAAQCDRGISVGLYSDLSPAEIAHIAGDSGARFAMVQDEEQLDKLAQVRDRLPALETILYWSYKGLGKGAEEDLIGLREVLDRGRCYEQEHPGVFEQNIAAGNAADVCAIVYTSGVEGPPKGALHSYRSLMAGSQSFCAADGLARKDDLVSYLPPAWISEQWLAFGCHLLSGGTVDFSENDETHLEDMREIAPSLAVYSSRLWESRAGQVRARLMAASRVKRLTSRAFLPIGDRVAGLREQGKKPGFGLLILDRLGDLLVFRKVRDSLGLPHARVCYSCGATLSPEAMRFFHALSVPLKNVYGSAEAGAVTRVVGGVQRRGTVGTVNPGVEVKLGDQGEMLVRHAGTFLGYQNDPEATSRVVRDGWVCTGDRCELKDGDVVFVDRLEDLVTMPCGDEVPPQEIESRLKYSPYIQDAWVFAGPECDFLSAVIIVDPANTGRWADKRKVNYTTFVDLSQKPEVYRLIAGEIATVNQTLPEDRRISRFVNLHKEFDPDEEELTRNRKLRRSLLAKRYADLVTALAGDGDSVEVEAEFTYQDGRVGKLKTAVRIATIGQGDR
jgi:long-chain acyl-CoA synthetase